MVLARPHVCHYEVGGFRMLRLLRPGRSHDVATAQLAVPTEGHDDGQSVAVPLVGQADRDDDSLVAVPLGDRIDPDQVPAADLLRPLHKEANQRRPP